MDNTQEYFRAIREKREELEQSHPGGLWLTLTPVRRVPHCVFVAPALGAKLLIDATHNLASETEIEMAKAANERANRRLAALAELRGPRHDGAGKSLRVLFGGRG